MTIGKETKITAAARMPKRKAHGWMSAGFIVGSIRLSKTEESLYAPACGTTSPPAAGCGILGIGAGSSI